MEQVQHSERSHAILSPSGASRWLACPPSARFAEFLPDETSEAAAEGTRAHEIAEQVLGLWTFPSSNYDVESDTIIADVVRALGWKACNDEEREMVEYAIGYANFIKSNVIDTLLPGFRHLAIETRLDLGLLIPEGFGTADFYAHDEETLHVVDYKFGRGVEVSAVENPQMMIYALGCLDEVYLKTGLTTIKNIVLHIYQPRARNRSSWSISREALEAWAEDTLAPRADMAYRGEGTFTTGTHCRFCKAKTICKTFADMVLSQDVEEYHASNTLSPDDLGDALAKGERLADWLEKAKERATALLSEGVAVKGYKLVRGRNTRFFHDEAEAGTRLKSLGYGDDQLYKTSLISVSGAEKLLGKKCFAETLGHLVGTKEGNPTLAPESDKRASINPFE